MTKKEWDKLTKQNLGLRKGQGGELKHIYRTKRQKPSAGTHALSANKYFGSKEDPFHKRINKRKPLQHGASRAMQLIGSGRGNSKLRELVFQYEHPLPARIKYGKGRYT